MLMKNFMMVWMLMVAASTVAQSGTGDVIGTFIDFNTQQPMAGAKAMIRENGRVYLALANEDGRFDNWYSGRNLPSSGLF